MEFNTWLIYLLAAIGLSLSPGPNGLLALTHGALHGRRKALYTIGGGALGFVSVIALSMFGIGALLMTSLVWLTVMKWVGGAYLVWLGIQVWRSPPIGFEVRGSAEPRAGWSLFRQGALSALTNPKGLLFFAAFLPQFLNAGQPLLPQLLVMTLTWAILDLCCKLAYGLGARGAARYLRTGKGHAWFNRTSAALFGCAGAASLMSR